MRKIISLFLSILLMFSIIIPTQVNAEDPIKVYINGEIINFSIDPVVENGTTLVQFRPIFEKLGLSIGWDANTQTVTGEKEGLKIELIIGNKVAKVNGVERNLSIAPKTIKGNTMIPLRFIGEASGEQVEWYGDSRTIQIGKQINLTKFTFRDTEWGMSKQQVINTEGRKPDYETDTILGYEGTITGFESLIGYYFVNGELYQGMYILSHQHTNKTDYIYDYNKIKKLLIDKYGQPTQDYIFWKDDLYRDDPDDWGMAIITGDLWYVSGWESNGTRIMLSLSGDNYEINFTLTYDDINRASEVTDDNTGL